MYVYGSLINANTHIYFQINIIYKMHLFLVSICIFELLSVIWHV